MQGVPCGFSALSLQLLPHWRRVSKKRHTVKELESPQMLGRILGKAGSRGGGFGREGEVLCEDEVWLSG